jgi:hypothetical protein
MLHLKGKYKDVVEHTFWTVWTACEIPIVESKVMFTKECGLQYWNVLIKTKC